MGAILGILLCYLRPHNGQIRKNQKKVYVFNHRESYSKFANASIESIGSATTDEIYLSPKNRENIGTFPKILAHELSHIHLRQHIGTWQYVTDIPGWFHEGIAVISSNGGGAEKISKKQAAQSLNRGHHFIPIEIGSIFGHESAHEYGLKPQMFYRQAELFVRYLQQSDSHAFKNSYIGIIKGEKFSEVWKKHYGMNVTELWNQFLNEIKA